MAGDLIGTIGAILVFVYVIAFCCLGDSNSSGGSTTKKRNTYSHNKRNTSSRNNSRGGYGPYDPGEYYSEWGDDGGYE